MTEAPQKPVEDKVGGRRRDRWRFVLGCGLLLAAVVFAAHRYFPGLWEPSMDDTLIQPQEVHVSSVLEESYLLT